MKISSKIALIVAIVILTLGVAQVIVGLRLILPSFTSLERANAHVDMDRAADALHAELDQLAVAAHDYGDWDDLFRFMQDRKPTYALSTEQVKSLNIDVLAVIDPAGRLVWSAAFAPGTTVPLKLAALEGAELPANHPWRGAVAAGGVARGFVPTEYGPLLGALAPILNGRGAGPARGSVLLGRFLTPKELARIAEQAHVKVDLRMAIPSGSARGNAAQVADDTLLEHEQTTEIYRSFRGIDAAPLFTLRAEIPRTISGQGRRSVLFATGSLTIFGAIILGALLVVLRRMVLEPLARLTRHAIEIGERDSVHRRLAITRTDEIGVLGNEFDRMIERLAVTRRELIERSFEAGVGEMASGALHNIGNVLTPLGVRVETLRQRLRGMPYADIEPTIALLAQHADEPAHRRDCVTLLTLLARECAGAIEGSSADVESIKRQLEDLKQLLAEQKRYARRSPLLENSDVAELVRRAVEVIPEELRRAVRLEVDASVTMAGALRLPRVTLQQVLQNVVLNAAQAIRAGGRGEGVLAVRARRIPADGWAPLRLELLFVDDGVGIAAEHMSRVFERGFTTKSLVSNSGFGLHWCATALHAIGGIIEARSDGAGRGATVRIVVPCEELDEGISDKAA